MELSSLNMTELNWAKVEKRMEEEKNVWLYEKRSTHFALPNRSVVSPAGILTSKDVKEAYMDIWVSVYGMVNMME